MIISIQRIWWQVVVSPEGCDFCDGIDYIAFLIGYISLWYSEMQFIDGTASASEDLPCISVGLLIIWQYC